MKENRDQPAVEQTARGLGVRAEGQYRDVSPDPTGLIHPGKGGLSVAPDDPLNLDQHRRPEEWGGTGKDPVWQIIHDVLPDNLAYRRDSRDHGLVEPATPTLLEDFRAHLAATSAIWTLKPYE
jgi:hypothetical protein